MHPVPSETGIAQLHTSSPHPIVCCPMFQQAGSYSAAGPCCSVQYSTLQVQVVAASRELCRELVWNYNHRRAPELFEVPSECVITAKTDVWSLGCSLYAAAFGQYAQR